MFHESRQSEMSYLCQHHLSTPVSSQVFKKKQEGHKSYTKRQYVKPFIPEMASHIHGARAGTGKGSPWNPGKWFYEEVSYGFSTAAEFNSFCERLFNCLIIKNTSADEDLLALRLLNSLNYDYQKGRDYSGPPISFSDVPKRKLYDWGGSSLHEEFVELFEFVLSNKVKYSRYRWLQMFDSTLRLFATATSVHRLQRPAALLNSMRSGKVEDANQTTGITYGETRSIIVKAQIQKYVIDYLTICHAVQKAGISAREMTTAQLIIRLNEQSSTLDIEQCKKRAFNDIKAYQKEFEFRKSSTLKNIKEFMEYVGIRKPDHCRRSLDFSYHYSKVGRDYRFEFSSALLFTLVNYAGEKMRASSFTSRNFSEVLANLGIHLPISVYASGTLGKQLMELGLVENASDSDSGMLFRILQ